ncbi:MAG: 30S ribosomal protein S9 [Flavobacteriales bacterium TMED288]|nr:30S ribosomal protein S9 [Flavobacteriales bacterium]RPG53800.1 MAG: 30S ribosomal protein S9 [Flavobacteriales bacterium TMED288]|tara:strand:+ start:4573 stop:4959 length:387 start_codon:yes stop_codon:yes gene_type:complete
MEKVHSIGRRKKSIARVYLVEGTGKFKINGREAKSYFKTESLLYKLNQAFIISDLENNYDMYAKVEGGGTTGQVEAIRLGISRALVKINPENRLKLKPDGLLTRDPRMVERKKPGQKKARKKFQFSKR